MMNQLNDHSAHSAKALYEKGLQAERINQEIAIKERYQEARANEVLKLHQITTEEIKHLREQQTQSEKSAQKREAEMNKRNMIFNLVSILIALASLAVALFK